ncbi:hypothetical protein Oweho_2991 [Owenweeksia hongkongensis DSM 17368]|uniref:Tetratricopeptide repeat protein n=1 Tax=Owenweeksia hongkongensis (strain DSM 17368 / CIP 108786 / JCM 12287 / NRRL B-23963 / UST20020801) TaxID=926562 RepID=G8R1Z6_OWEHD|nr:hypothetical protein [Owenweeksia hongkongensis]AEV33946.1 hypothetical protein Oweho_2991 [Owenweeksia hongkongensis DSM 17368]
MGWGGSAQAMIHTLRANKDLLRKRKILFERDRTFGEIKKRYTKASAGILKAPSPSQSDLKKIRDRIVKQRKKEIIITVIATIISTTIITIGIHLIYTNLVSQNLQKWEEKEVYYKRQQSEEYKTNIKEGLEKMEAGNYFFAIGNFSEALDNAPNDSLAEYHLAYAYCLLCKIEKKGCSRAFRLVEELSLKHPKNLHYPLLEVNYLQSH